MIYLFTMRLSSDDLPTRSLTANYEFEASIKVWLAQQKIRHSYDFSKPLWQHSPTGPKMIGFRPLVITLYDVNDAVQFKLEWGDEFDCVETYDMNGSFYYVIKDDKSDS
jgi:hypothetical protein